MLITIKQKDVLELRANGISTKEIANRHNVSRQAVQKHIAIACDQLSANDVTHAVAIMVSLGKIKVEI